MIPTSHEVDKINTYAKRNAIYYNFLNEYVYLNCKVELSTIYRYWYWPDI